ncbi:type II secretion system F family protein [Patescibacteria group bacterium]|nr:type II secretion system F family protein [Patescibacteria group bacterium]
MWFSYQASDKEGKIKNGTIEATSREEARNKLTLRLKDDVLISLAEGKTKQKKKKGEEIVFGRVRLLEKVMFAKHLSVMVKAGMSIDNALETLAGNASPIMAKRLKSVLDHVRRGHTLSSALKAHPKDFDMLFVNMVAAGEKGGNLAKNLDLLSIQQRKSYELKNKIKAAAMYPTMVLIAIVGLTAVISKFVLPKIVNFFDSLRIDLPTTTKILMAVASFFANYWIWVILGLVILMLIWNFMLKIRPSRLFLHKIIISLPITGKITKNMNLALFCRTLSSLLSSGITIDQSLQIVAETLTNDVFKNETIALYHKVLKGNSLADALRSKSHFPSIVSRMTKVGEESGNLGEVLDYLADFYELEVDTDTKNLSTLLEPILLVVIGLGVGFVAMAIINPIYDLTSQVGR